MFFVKSFKKLVRKDFGKNLEIKKLFKNLFLKILLFKNLFSNDIINGIKLELLK